ncbi:MAG: SDR family oxidoreductase [Rhodobacteraceae bacterium]|nr:SDR family oxidoreductase [Paracoccaceae bacterium]
MGGSIVITGASSGIGRATAERFLAGGWNVALLARRAAALAEVAAGRPAALALPCDVTDPAQVDAAFAAAARHFGRIDALFNNAGVSRPAAPIDEIPLEDWTATVAVNLTGMFLCARAAFRQMRRQDPQGGRIVNNGSISAHAPRPGSVCYTTTKHGVTGLTRTLALDGRPFGIACGQIDIGNALTDMAARFRTGVPQADGSIRTEPVMDVADVAGAVWSMVTLPASANVLSMTIMATNMPFVGRG